MGLGIVASLAAVGLAIWVIARAHRDYKATCDVRAQAIEGQQKGLAIAENSRDDWKQWKATVHEIQKREIELAEERLAVAQKQLEALDSLKALLEDIKQRLGS